MMLLLLLPLPLLPPYNGSILFLSLRILMCGGFAYVPLLPFKAKRYTNYAISFCLNRAENQYDSYSCHNHRVVVGDLFTHTHKSHARIM
jgi:hypothetical protein